jgi:magnesium transporter
VLLEDIMEDPMTTLTPDLDQEDVAYRFQKYSLASAPVTDSANRLVGMITVDDMVDVIQEEHSEDLLALSNVSSADASDTVFETVKARAPWLAVNLLDGLHRLRDHRGVRGCHRTACCPRHPDAGRRGPRRECRQPGTRRGRARHRHPRPRRRRLPAARCCAKRSPRSSTASSSGLASASSHWSGSRISSCRWSSPPPCWATFLWAGLSGILVPLTLKRLGADPAVASSVFVLTLTDVMAFFTFLGLASLVLL